MPNGLEEDTVDEGVGDAVVVDDVLLAVVVAAAAADTPDFQAVYIEAMVVRGIPAPMQTSSDLLLLYDKVETEVQPMTAPALLVSVVIMETVDVVKVVFMKTGYLI